MKLQHLFKMVLTVGGLIACLAHFAAASVVDGVTKHGTEGLQLGRSFAVFVASYSAATGEARGGVAGSAFFVSPTRAVTAFHVLQKASFAVPTGFEKTRVWLVHEKHPPIEITVSDIATQPERDLTTIQLTSQSIAKEFILGVSASGSRAGDLLYGEGFIAGSTGPELEWSGRDLVIRSVPRLERLILEGKLVQKARVNLDSADVKLKGVDCLQTSYAPVRGMSGGPVVSREGLVGMNSFMDPQTMSRTWAVDLSR